MNRDLQEFIQFAKSGLAFIGWTTFYAAAFMALFGVVLVTMGVGAKNPDGIKIIKSEEKTILCHESKPQKVFVQPGRVTVLSFPLAPKEVLPGGAIFEFKQIRNDLAIKTLRTSGATNIVVYLEDRRCIFDVRAVGVGGNDVLVVRDAKENLIEVEYK